MTQRWVEKNNLWDSFSRATVQKSIIRLVGAQSHDLWPKAKNDLKYDLKELPKVRCPWILRWQAKYGNKVVNNRCSVRTDKADTLPSSEIRDNGFERQESSFDWFRVKVRRQSLPIYFEYCRLSVSNRYQRSEKGTAEGQRSSFRW